MCLKGDSPKESAPFFLVECLERGVRRNCCDRLKTIEKSALCLLNQSVKSFEKSLLYGT